MDTNSRIIFSVLLKTELDGDFGVVVARLFVKQKE